MEVSEMYKRGLKIARDPYMLVTAIFCLVCFAFSLINVINEYMILSSLTSVDIVLFALNCCNTLAMFILAIGLWGLWSNVEASYKFDFIAIIIGFVGIGIAFIGRVITETIHYLIMPISTVDSIATVGNTSTYLINYDDTELVRTVSNTESSTLITISTIVIALIIIAFECVMFYGLIQSARSGNKLFNDKKSKWTVSTVSYYFLMISLIFTLVFLLFGITSSFMISGWFGSLLSMFGTIILPTSSSVLGILSIIANGVLIMLSLLVLDDVKNIETIKMPLKKEDKKNPYKGSIKYIKYPEK